MTALVDEGLERQGGHLAGRRRRALHLSLRRGDADRRGLPRGQARRSIGPRARRRAVSWLSSFSSRAAFRSTRAGAVLFNHSSRERTDDTVAAPLYAVARDALRAVPDNAWRSPHEREVRRYRGRQRLRRQHHRLPARGEGHEGPRARAGPAVDADRIPAQARRSLDLRRPPAREAQRMARPAVLQEDDRGAGRRRRRRIAGVQQRGDGGAPVMLRTRMAAGNHLRRTEAPLRHRRAGDEPADAPGRAAHRSV